MGHQSRLTSGRTARPGHPAGTTAQDAYRGICDAALILEILLDMADADMNGSRPMQAAGVEFLVKQLRGALELIEPALDHET